MEPKCVSVQFIGSNRNYHFMTDLPLEPGCTYSITNDSGKKYSTPVIVNGYVNYTPVATAWIINAIKED